MTLKVDYTIDELLDCAGQLEDMNWLYYIVSRDPIAAKFSSEFISTMVANARAAALDMHRQMVRMYGKRTAAEYAQLLNIDVVEVCDKTEFDYIYMSTYTQDPPQITVYNSAAQIVDKVMQGSSYSGEINAAQFREVAIAHEIFHHLELSTAGIYTQQKIFSYKALGIFPRQVSPLSVSEVAAVYFSKLLTDSGYAPLVYELIVQFSGNKLLARELLEKLENSTGKKR